MPWPFEKQVSGTRRSPLGLLVGGLLLVAFIGFLLASNYRSQKALRESNLESHLLGLEKHAAAIAYFFSERRYDLRMLAGSPEISAFFINKTLGMSEPYGLKASLYNIHRRFEDAIAEKCLHGTPIYTRLLLVDPSGVALVDTAEPDQGGPQPPRDTYLRPARQQPEVLVADEAGHAQVLLTVPCFHDNRFAGQLFVWLGHAALYHLLQYNPPGGDRPTRLMTARGQLIHPPGESPCPLAPYLTPERINRLLKQDFEVLKASFGGRGQTTMLTRSLPIPSTPLYLIASIPASEVTGYLAPWQLLVGTGTLAVVILAVLAALMRVNTQNLVLKTRFESSENQQAMLAAKNRQLEEEIRRRGEIEKALEEQRLLRVHSDRLRSLGEMAAGIAHELNQPLVGVRGMAELIVLSAENERGFSREKTRKKAAIILEQADRMVHIIQHVRLFARESGQPETSVVDLNDVVHSGIGLLKAQFRAHGLRLETAPAHMQLPVRINPYSVEEVLLNLLTNARDALETQKRTDGPGFSPRIRIATFYACRNGAATVGFKVEDNGGGIPTEIGERVFDPFFTTKGPDKGTGLGLSICKTIIEDLGGRIRFTTEKSRGTTFTVTFPFHAGRNEEKNGNPEAVQNPGGG
jgi:signal transduction histidine kinase